jgi:outer membrane protein TolC
MPITRLLANVAMCLPCLLAMGGCSAEHYSRQADTDATRILERVESAATAERLLRVQKPALIPDSPEGAVEVPQATQGKEAPEPRVLNLTEALEMAVHGNRAHLERRESLYLQALSLRGARHQFSPQVNLSLSYLFNDGDDGPSSHSVGMNGGVSQILPWGGSISLGANSGFDESEAHGDFSTSASITLTQPLLRGAGAAISHESLIQAERSMIYALRSFELAREDFSIDVARRFYDLVQSSRTIANLESNLEEFVFSRRQAEALFKVGRATEIDVLRARRSELNSQDSLISSEESRLLELDRFRVFLGLSKEQRVEVQPEAPVFTSANYNVEQAVELALGNRLDLLNRTEQLEDTRRGLGISKDNLRPDMSFTAGFGTSAPASGGFTNQAFGRDAFTAGLSLDLPVDRVSEGNNYRRAQINAAQAERDYEQFRDELVVQIRSSFRELERRRQSLGIQEELILGQEKNVRIAQLRFEQGGGGVDNRDVTEANDQLLEARNRMIDERVNYEISRLNLLKDLGILFIDKEGMFQE